MLGSDQQESRALASLTELAAPWLLFLTSFRRKVHTQESGPNENQDDGGGNRTVLDPATLDWVEVKVRGFLDDMRQASAQNPTLSVAIQEAKFPLVYFTIEILQSCGWPEDTERENRLFAPDSFETQIGGEDFYKRAHDPNLQNPEVIEVFYKCLCLGFRGMYADQSMRLREERERLMRRLPLENPSGPHFCPQAYEHTDTRDFVKLPIVATARIAIAAIALIILIFFVSGQAAKTMLNDVDQMCKEITNALTKAQTRSEKDQNTEGDGQ